MITISVSVWAQKIVVIGDVSNDLGEYLPGVVVSQRGASNKVVTDGSGNFKIEVPANAILVVKAVGYKQTEIAVRGEKQIHVVLKNDASSNEGVDGFGEEAFVFDEDEVLDDEGMAQSVGSIQGATDDIYYQASNYEFNSVARFNWRGYDQNESKGYINGVNFNDAIRGRFNFSGLGGMTSSAFRNRSTEIGLEAAQYAFGSIGGSTNYTTYASEYAPGFRGNVSYTNSNYKMRAMLQYSTGLSRDGWAFSAAVIGRYAPEGVIEGTFYNSLGYFMSLEKVINDHHRINISTWGAPTQRAANTAATQEAYDLAGSNFYNPSWGYLNGEKKSAKIIESFSPSALVNWIWNPTKETRLNTAFAFEKSMYSSSALNWYQTADPRPDYYRNLPSYFLPTADGDVDPDLYAAQLSEYNYVKDWWSVPMNRQIDWNRLYQINQLNNKQYDRDPSLVGQASYILENRHSNYDAYSLNTYLDRRLNEILTLQGGANVKFTDAHYYKTIRNLLGAEFWRDVDNFSERDFAGNLDILQNDMRNPNRKVGVGDVFGYDYNIRNWQANAWLQNQINVEHWNLNYGAEFNFTNFSRYGNMQNGRAPENSLGQGINHSFYNGALKAGASYKFDGRNYITVHASYGSKAPLADYSYVSPRTKDETVSGLKSEQFLATDINYTWNYTRFRGSIGGYFTHMWDAITRTGFYDYQLNTFMNYSMSGMELEYKGIELGAQYKITNALSVTAAGTLSSSRYKNNPMGVRSYENGSQEDVVRQVYLKNYRIGGSPQQVYSLSLNYNIKQWFLEANGQWIGDNWISLSPARHEEMPGLWKFCSSEEQYIERRDQITKQDRLNGGFIANLSIGKMIYTKFGSLNFNFSVNNVLNNRHIQTGGYQEGKFDYTDYNVNKFPNKYYYAQGIRIFANVGIRF